MSEYTARSLKDWMELVKNNQLALPEFQRSYVWDAEKTQRLLRSLIKGHPVGALLLMEATTPNDAMFRTRPILGGPHRPETKKELVLDGQQRLTSLWRAFNGNDIKKKIKNLDKYGNDLRYYLNFHGNLDDQLQFTEVVSRKLKETQDSAQLLRSGLVPIDVLGFSTVTQSKNTLYEWCNEASEFNNCSSGKIQNEILYMVEKLHNSRLYFAVLDKSMDRQECIEIFTTVNQSAVKVSDFDIAVAGISKNPESRPLRERLEEWITAPQQQVLESYIPSDTEESIQYVGELVFKVSCLRKGLIPTVGRYNDKKVLVDVSKNFVAIMSGVSYCYELLMEERIWTKDMLPSEVPLRVVPALHERVCQLKADKKGYARSIIKQYLWQAFLSDRYSRAANERLKNDYDVICGMLDHIKLGKTVAPLRILGDIPDYKDMVRLDGPLAGVGARNSLLKAFLAMSLRENARDFASGDNVRPESITGRQRHHLYPRKFLDTILMPSFPNKKDRDRCANHVLNFALVDGSTNSALGRESPREYLDKRYVRNGHLEAAELRQRVESHVIPFVELYVGPVADVTHYQRFIEARAKCFEPIIGKLTGMAGTEDADALECNES